MTFFMLILTNFLDVILDSVHKGLKLAKLMKEKSFKLFSHYKPSSWPFNFLLILLLRV